MGGALEAATRQLFDALERKDADAVIRVSADDVQGVDEISRRWMRGIDELRAYIKQLVAMVDDVHTTVSDVHETVQGNLGLMTCWVEQDYMLEGKQQHVSAPTTVAYRQESGAWKLLLFHSVPLPAEES
jgi:ketosteroid isomerase-like protein